MQIKSPFKLIIYICVLLLFCGTIYMTLNCLRIRNSVNIEISNSIYIVGYAALEYFIETKCIDIDYDILVSAGKLRELDSKYVGLAVSNQIEGATLIEYAKKINVRFPASIDGISIIDGILKYSDTHKPVYIVSYEGDYGRGDEKYNRDIALRWYDHVICHP